MNSSGFKFNSNPNFDFPYEIEFGFGSEAIDILKKDRKNLAAQNFLHLFRELRMILLQNSMIMRLQFLQYLIWRDPIFVRENYIKYAFKVERSLENIEEFKKIQFRKIIFMIAERLTVVQY
jgi:hypothetical protein